MTEAHTYPAMAVTSDGKQCDLLPVTTLNGTSGGNSPVTATHTAYEIVLPVDDVSCGTTTDANIKIIEKSLVNKLRVHHYQSPAATAEYGPHASSSPVTQRNETPSSSASSSPPIGLQQTGHTTSDAIRIQQIDLIQREKSHLQQLYNNHNNHLYRHPLDSGMLHHQTQMGSSMMLLQPRPASLSSPSTASLPIERLQLHQSSSSEIRSPSMPGQLRTGIISPQPPKENNSCGRLNVTSPTMANVQSSKMTSVRRNSIASATPSVTSPVQPVVDLGQSLSPSQQQLRRASISAGNGNNSATAQPSTSSTAVLSPGAEQLTRNAAAASLTEFSAQIAVAAAVAGTSLAKNTAPTRNVDQWAQQHQLPRLQQQPTHPNSADTHWLGNHGHTVDRARVMPSAPFPPTPIAHPQPSNKAYSYLAAPHVVHPPVPTPTANMFSIQRRQASLPQGQTQAFQQPWPLQSSHQTSHRAPHRAVPNVAMPMGINNDPSYLVPAGTMYPSTDYPEGMLIGPGYGGFGSIAGNDQPFQDMATVTSAHASTMAPVPPLAEEAPGEGNSLWHASQQAHSFPPLSSSSSAVGSGYAHHTHPGRSLSSHPYTSIQDQLLQAYNWPVQMATPFAPSGVTTSPNRNRRRNKDQVGDTLDEDQTFKTRRASVDDPSLSDFNMYVDGTSASKPENTQAPKRSRSKRSRSSRGNKTFGCPECDKLFNRLEHVKRHMLMHTGERAYQCEICLKHFSRSDNLQQHYKIHSKPPRAERPPPAKREAKKRVRKTLPPSNFLVKETPISLGDVIRGTDEDYEDDDEDEEEDGMMFMPLTTMGFAPHEEDSDDMEDDFGDVPGGHHM